MDYGIQLRKKSGEWQDFKDKHDLSAELITAGTANLKLYTLSLTFRGPVGELSKLPDGDYSVVGPDPRDPQWCGVLVKRGESIYLR